MPSVVPDLVELDERDVPFGPAMSELRGRLASLEPVTIVWPADSPVPTVGGKWRRLPSGEIEAGYTREELALCLALSPASVAA